MVPGIKPMDFADPLAFPIAPPSGPYYHLSIDISLYLLQQNPSSNY